MCKTISRASAPGPTFRPPRSRSMASPSSGTTTAPQWTAPMPRRRPSGCTMTAPSLSAVSRPSLSKNWSSSPYPRELGTPAPSLDPFGRHAGGTPALQGGGNVPGYAHRSRGGLSGRRGRAAKRAPRLPLRLWQRAAKRGDPRHPAAGAKRAADAAARALHRAIVGEPVHRAASAEPTLLALPHPPLGAAQAVPADRQWAPAHRAMRRGDAVAKPAALEPAALSRRTDRFYRRASDDRHEWRCGGAQRHRRSCVSRDAADDRPRLL